MSAKPNTGTAIPKTAEKETQTDWVAIKNEKDVVTAEREAESAREQATRLEAENVALRRQIQLLERDFVKAQGELVELKQKAARKTEQERKPPGWAEKVQGDTSDEGQPVPRKGENQRRRAYSDRSDQSETFHWGLDRGNGDRLGD